MARKRNVKFLTFLILVFYLIFVLCKGVSTKRHKLKQVVALSRHNLRTPLTSNLERVTPKSWPKWSAEIGHLTPKGVSLEELMGEYFAAWLNKEELFSTKCPNESVYVYANSKQRTKETARAFARAAFKNCDIIVHYKFPEDKMDPIFNPVIHNDTLIYKDIVNEVMEKKMEEKILTEAYLFLNEIIDLKNSNICKTDSICDLTKAKNEIFYKVGWEPNVKGPLGIGNSIVDPFMMAYYDGMDMEDVAWGKVSQPHHWKLLMEINKQNHNVRFNSSVIGKDVAKPLVNYIADIFLDETKRFALLVGHDSNIYSIMAALNFKPYELPEQYEKVPIGGKLLFQKWYDNETEQDFLQIHYVYQSTDQLRNGDKLTLVNPPKWVSLEVVGCNVDVYGYCLWSDFMNILRI